MFSTSIRHSLVKAPIAPAFFSSNASKLSGLHGMIAATATRQMSLDIYESSRLHRELSNDLEKQSKRVTHLLELLKKQALPGYDKDTDRIKGTIANLNKIEKNLYEGVLAASEDLLTIGNDLFCNGFEHIAINYFDRVIKQCSKINSLDFRIPVILSTAYSHKALSLIASCRVDGKNLTDTEHRLSIVHLLREALYYNSENELAESLLQKLNTPESLGIGSYQELIRAGLIPENWGRT